MLRSQLGKRQAEVNRLRIVVVTMESARQPTIRLNSKSS